MRGRWWWAAPRPRRLRKRRELMPCPRRLRKRRKPRELMLWGVWARAAREKKAWLADFTRAVTREHARVQGRERELAREQARVQGRERRVQERERHVGTWGREIEKKESSLVWKTLLVWGVALVFVWVFMESKDRAESRAVCLRDALLFEHYEYEEWGLTLRERLMLGDLCGIPGLSVETRRWLNENARQWLSEEGVADGPRRQ